MFTEESVLRKGKILRCTLNDMVKSVIPTNGGISIFDRKRFFTTLCSVLNDMVKSVIPTNGRLFIFDSKVFITTRRSVLIIMVQSVPQPRNRSIPRGVR